MPGESNEKPINHFCHETQSNSCEIRLDLYLFSDLWHFLLIDIERWQLGWCGNSTGKLMHEHWPLGHKINSIIWLSIIFLAYVSSRIQTRLVLQHLHHNLTFMACTTASGFCAAVRYPVTGGGRSPPCIRVDPCGQMDTHSSRSKITHTALSDYQKRSEHWKSP